MFFLQFKELLKLKYLFKNKYFNYIFFKVKKYIIKKIFKNKYFNYFKLKNFYKNFLNIKYFFIKKYKKKKKYYFNYFFFSFVDFFNKFCEIYLFYFFFFWIKTFSNIICDLLFNWFVTQVALDRGLGFFVRTLPVIFNNSFTFDKFGFKLRIL